MAEVALVGVVGGEVFGRAAAAAVAGADVVIGSRRHLDAVALAAGAERVELVGPLDAALAQAAVALAGGRRVCLLASGDPGFFGLLRLAAARLGRAALAVYPAPTSVALACARAGLAWDDAVVVSAHGRDPATAAEAIAARTKVAVFCSPAAPPQAVAAAALAAGAGRREVVVAERLGEAGERVTGGDLGTVAAGRFDPLSVLLAVAPGTAGQDGPPLSWEVAGGTRPGSDGMGAAWGRPEHRFRHRDGMVTKAEVRAVALGKLGLPPVGVLWDVGAGSGSVTAEALALAPGLEAYAVERGATADLAANLEGTGAVLVAGEAPDALAGLPDPDRVFVGGGGLAVLDAVLARLRPGGRVVATFASPARAAAAWDRLGHLVQVSVARAVPAGSAGMRLAAENPVFVCWGPEE